LRLFNKGDNDRNPSRYRCGNSSQRLYAGAGVRNRREAALLHDSGEPPRKGVGKGWAPEDIRIRKGLLGMSRRHCGEANVGSPAFLPRSTLFESTTEALILQTR
jgi:hypothetical protein